MVSDLTPPPPYFFYNAKLNQKNETILDFQKILEEKKLFSSEDFQKEIAKET